MRTRIAVFPEQIPELLAAVERGGGDVVEPVEASAVIWTAMPDPARLARVLNPGHRWVSLLSAGVDSLVGTDVFDERRVWTCARSVYAGSVAEHALALLLALRRGIVPSARVSEWSPVVGARTLAGARVAVLGTGEIGVRVASLLRACNASAVGINRTGAQQEGFERCWTVDDLHHALAGADALVVCAPLTAATRGLVDAQVLSRLGHRAHIVNVARGAIIDSEALVMALNSNTIAGAGLDVTNPEPLPANHPLWRCHNAVITPHIANPSISGMPWEMNLAALERHVESNVVAFRSGSGFDGQVSVRLGY